MTHRADPSPEQEAEERLLTLAELDRWLRTPMLVLSAAWLALVLVELAWGAIHLLETLGTVIWVVFLAEFALRLTLAPDRLAFSGQTGSRRSR